MLRILSAFLVVWCLQAADVKAQLDTFDTVLEDQIFSLINKERAQRSYPPFMLNLKLTTVARDHSQNMAKQNFFSHISPSGADLISRIGSRVPWRYIGENIFKTVGYSDPARLVVRKWMDSPRHRDNILNRSYRESGIGVYRWRDSILITQIFLLQRP